MRVLFPFIGQIHQIPHALPIAAELASRHPEAEVHVAFLSAEQERFIKRLLASYLPDARVHLRQFKLHPLDKWRTRSGRTPWKQLTLLVNRPYLAAFDAIVTPEQTTLDVRRFLHRSKLIWTRHGAGDRDCGFAGRTRHFDFVLLAGPKIEKRLLSRNLIRNGRYATGIYAKFDWLRRRSRTAPRLFDNERKTILYNPHFRPKLSSWQPMGRSILEQFAGSGRFNLIFAPHVRLVESLTGDDLAYLDTLRHLPHVRIDLGSDLSADMTYTSASDLYVGDVSSQVAEFLVRPKPCLFLNPRLIDWQSDPAYQHWNLGPVATTALDMQEQVSLAFETHQAYRARQAAYFAETFGASAHGPGSAAIGADAIASFLRAHSRSLSRTGIEGACG